MNRLFDPRKALFAAYMEATREPALLVDTLLDKEHVYTSPELPLGFTVHVTIKPIPEPVIIHGLTLVKGTVYNVTVETYTHRTQHLNGWTFAGEQWGSLVFYLKKANNYAGPSRSVRRSGVLAIEVAE